MDYADILYLIVWYTVKRTKQKIRYDHCRIIPYITVWQMAIYGNIFFINQTKNIIYTKVDFILLS